MKKIDIFRYFYIVLILLCSCKKKDDVQYYQFIKSHCAYVTVGGVVGIREKCFAAGERVEGKQINNNTILIRIAAHRNENDQPPYSNSYQEFLEVPAENLKFVGD
ncbi:hypothetical protein [Pedobacter agri]|uniref:hypothetical protein n=1 Tax=Pedobacter agri TaxID=454586 RepID=UPI00292D9054|nr:hypothetical protein [Pedobacter agri]